VLVAGREAPHAIGELVIPVTRLDGSVLYLNAEFIQSVESTPDTHIVLMNGQSYVVTEPDVEIVERIVGYRRSVYSGGPEGAAALRMVQGQ
jgi:flagellar protein FlbD